MRWPLRNQILVPNVALMLITLVGVSALNAWLSVRRTRSRIEAELQAVVETLADSSLPVMQDSILQKMSGLSGADFVVLNPSNQIEASSFTQPPAWRTELLASHSPSATESSAPIRLTNRLRLGTETFFHAALPIKPVLRAGTANTGIPNTLHILYPEQSYRQAWRDAVWPPLLIGAIAILLVSATSLVLASRVTRPLQRLQSELNRIGSGDFADLPAPQRDDEIADVATAVNQLSKQLQHYENQVRRQERLSTLGQLGSGIAHQMRNSAAGCRIALQLHQRRCQNNADGDEMQVAVRQLELMEKYLQRFMALGQTSESTFTTVDLHETVQGVIKLVEPTARHVGVNLHLQLPETSCTVRGDAEDLEQVLVNLLLNAIEAVTEQGTDLASRDVSLQVVTHGEQCEIRVTDNGAGPPASIRDRLFEPFVTQKRDGTGLGLSVASEIVSAHAGNLSWSRDDDLTVFCVQLPAVSSASSV